MSKNQAAGDGINWDDIDEFPEVTDEDLFPYGHGPGAGD